MTADDPVGHFLARAAELADCASLVDESVEDRQQFLLTPTNPNGLGVRFISWGGDEDWINFDDPVSAPQDWGVKVESVDWFIDAAVEGRVRVLRGPGRGVTEVRRRDGRMARSYYGDGLGSFLPRLGWKRHAQIIDYEPYR